MLTDRKVESEVQEFFEGGGRGRKRLGPDILSSLRVSRTLCDVSELRTKVIL